MADKLFRVELTASFLERLDIIDAFLVEADAGSEFDGLLAELMTVTLRSCARQWPEPADDQNVAEVAKRTKGAICAPAEQHFEKMSGVMKAHLTKRAAARVPPPSLQHLSHLFYCGSTHP